jgi:hypothetical protein
MVLMTGVYENRAFLYRTHKIFLGSKTFHKKKIVDKSETHALCPVQFYAGSYSS